MLLLIVRSFNLNMMEKLTKVDKYTFVVIFFLYFCGGVMEFWGYIDGFLGFFKDSNLKNYSNIIQFCVALGTILSVVTALCLSLRNNKVAFFNANFSLLLEQHNNMAGQLLANKENYKQKVDYVLTDGFDKLGLSDANKRMHQNDHFFGSYFRVLYHLLKHIDRNYHSWDLSGKKRKYYTSLVRSFLNSEITLLLAINVSHADRNSQYWGYRVLVEKYSLLEHLILDGNVFIDALSDITNTAHRFAGLLEEDGGEYKSGMQILDEICLEFNEKCFGNNEWLSIYKEVNAK